MRRSHRPPHSAATVLTSAKSLPLLTNPKNLGKMSLGTGPYHPIGAWPFDRRNPCQIRSNYDSSHVQMSFETTVRLPVRMVAIPNSSMRPVAGSGTLITSSVSKASVSYPCGLSASICRKPYTWPAPGYSARPGDPNGSPGARAISNGPSGVDAAKIPMPSSSVISNE